MIVRYDDPEFSRRHDLVIADGSDAAAILAAKRTVTATAWNREYVAGASPLTKYTSSDPHVIRMAELHARVVS
jgi:hypothetical protein